MEIYNKQGRFKSSLKDVDQLINEKFDFTNCDLSGLTINDKVFEGMFFDNVDFDRADLSGCIFISCHFRGASFKRTVIEGCEFIKGNFRESDFTQCFLTGSKFEHGNLMGCQFVSAKANMVEWLYCDMRNTNFRGADVSRGDFEGSRIKGMNTRNCCLNRCNNFPPWMTDTMLSYRLGTDPEDVNIGFKLTNEDSGGIYHPVVEYKVGETYTVEDTDPITNPGIAIAPLDWILREWVMLGAQPYWKLFKVEFKTKDILGEDGAVKFNCREIKVVEEIPLKQFLDTILD